MKRIIVSIILIALGVNLVTLAQFSPPDNPTPAPTSTEEYPDPPTDVPTDGPPTDVPQPTDEPTPTTAEPTEAAPAVTIEPTEPTLPVDPVPGGMYVTGELGRGLVRPNFIWSPQVTGQWYNLVLVDASDTPVIDQWFEARQICAEALCTITPADELLPVGLVNGDYRWWVRAWAGDDYTEWAEGERFSVAVPDPLPPNFTVDVSLGYPVIQVADDPGAAWYHVYIESSDATHQHREWYAPEACNGTTCRITVEANPSNGDYQIYMQAWGPGGYNDQDETSWHGPVTFNIDWRPAGQPTPIMSSLDEGQPTFVWGGASNTTWYQLQVTNSTDATILDNWFSARELGCEGGSMCILELEDLALDPNESYFWQLRAWGPGGTQPTTGWTESRVFGT